MTLPVSRTSRPSLLSKSPTLLHVSRRSSTSSIRGLVSFPECAFSLSPNSRKSFLVDPFSRPRFPAVSVVGRQQMAPPPLLPRLLDFGLAFQARPFMLQGGLRDRLGPRPSFIMILPLFPLPELSLLVEDRPPSLTRTDRAFEDCKFTSDR